MNPEDVYQKLVSQWMGNEEESQDVEDLSQLKWLPVSSSNLEAVAYVEKTLQLYISFLDGSVYEYRGVPKEEYIGLMKAYDSHGEYFYDNIRMVYEYERRAG